MARTNAPSASAPLAATATAVNKSVPCTTCHMDQFQGDFHRAPACRATARLSGQDAHGFPEPRPREQPSHVRAHELAHARADPAIASYLSARSSSSQRGASRNALMKPSRSGQRASHLVQEMAWRIMPRLSCLPRRSFALAGCNANQTANATAQWASDPNPIHYAQTVRRPLAGGEGGLRGPLADQPPRPLHCAARDPARLRPGFEKLGYSLMDMFGRSRFGSRPIPAPH